jgi:hypothetical protein
MKFITPKIHGILDMLVTVVLFVAPSLFGFGREASAVSYTLGAAYIVVILATAYPYGLVKLLPFTVHGAIELVLSPLLIAMPWIAGFSYDMAGRAFFVAAGVLLFVVWLTTDYKAADIAYRKKGIDVGGDEKRRMRTA